MILGGWQKLSLIDYPDTIATVLFTSGCVFRCGFCHNPELVIPPFPGPITEDSVFSYLEKRTAILEGVVVSGGEPTVHHDLPDFLQRIKTLGYKVKLDTCGYRPSMLADVIEKKLVDYIAMDIKAPYEKYSLVTQITVDTALIKKSIHRILSSAVPHEFRTTLIGEMHREQDIVAMAQMIAGADAYYLQRFRQAPKLLDPSFQGKTAPSESVLQNAVERCKLYVKTCKIRD